MIADGVVDAINDFTTLELHHQVAEAAFQAGKHVMTQKPLAISVAAAQQMIRQAHEAGVTLGTFENVRNSAFTRAAGWAVRRGLIGAPQMAIMGSIGGMWSPDKIVAETPWRHRKLLGGGGGAIDIGVHYFDMLRYIFGEVAWVSATARTFEKERYRRDELGNIVDRVEADVDDTFFATTGFENDAIGQLLWSWAGRGEPMRIGDAPAFYGSEGCIKGGELMDEKGNRTPLVPYFEQHMSEDEHRQFFPYGLTDTFALQQLDWLRAAAAGTESETSGTEGLHDLACSFGMLESSALRRQVTLEEVLSGAANAYQAEINEHYGLSVSQS
jgi:predicted dehydrogenase